MRSFFNQARRLPSGLVLNLICPRVQLLSTWHPMHTCVCCCFSIRVVDTLKNFLNSVSPVGIIVEASSICLLLATFQRTKNDSSLSITQKRFFIAVTELSFAGAIGVGKKARNTRSKSCKALFFFAGVLGVLELAVHAVALAWESSVAVEAAMVEKGGLAIGPCRLT